MVVVVDWPGLASREDWRPRESAGEGGRKLAWASQHVHDDSFLVPPSQIWEANYLRIQDAWSTHIIYAQNGGKTNPVR